MQTIVEIRPREDRRGFNLTRGTLALWYRSEEHALSYAQNQCTGSEIRIFDDAGVLTRTIPANAVSCNLSSW